MDTGYYSPARRNYYNSASRGASPEEIRSSLRSVQRDYVKALEEISDLKNEKASLKAVISHSLQDKNEEEYREYAASMESASQRLKQSYTQKALIETEERVVELEDENIKLRRLLDNNSTRLKKLQTEIVSYQDQVDKLDHLQVFNRHLQAEMQYLDQELNVITKRVEDLDDEKTKAKIKKSVSVKYSQDYNQTLLKYVNHIISTINYLDQSDPVRARFEELFPISSNILKLVANRDYANLMLKSFKFIADLLPKNLDQEQLSPTFSQATLGSFSPSRHLSQSGSNGQLLIQGLDVSRNSSHVTTNPRATPVQTSSAKKAPTPSANNKLSGAGLSASGSGSDKPKVVRQDSISSSNGKKPREQKLSVSFGVKEFKPRLLRSTTPHAVRPSDSISSLKTNHSAAQKNELMVERTTSSQAERRESEKRSTSFSSKKEELHDQVAAELEYIQRERELIEKERELMEKQRELIGKAKELEEKQQALQEHQFQEERYINETESEQSRAQSHKKAQGSYAALRKVRQEEREQTRSPTGLKPILKSSSSQVIAMDQDKRSVGSTPINGNKTGGVKDFSNVLREKSKHLAKVLNAGSSYEDEIQMINVRGDQEASIAKGSNPSKSRERTPMSSYKTLEYEGGFDQLRGSKVSSTTNKKAVMPVEYEDSPYTQECDGSEKRGYYPGSGASTFKSNSNIASYHPTPVESKRREEREYRREDSMKKVSFDGQDDSIGEDVYATVQQQQYRALSNLRAREEDDEYSLSTLNKSGRRTERADVVKGTQYASFSVSFGRTESAERSSSPSGKDAGSILDVPMKKRVDHTFQTYDVITGEDVNKIAIHDNWSPQYKVAVEQKVNKLKKPQQRTQTPTSSSSIKKNKL